MMIVKTLIALLLLTISFGKGTFVLIHGATSGAWEWFKVRTILEEKGHDVITPNLPSLGIDNKDPKTVQLQDHVDSVVEILDSLSEPVVLVGHSYGGVVVSLVSEARPDKVKKAVYLTALMLQDGESVSAALQRDTKSMTGENMVITADGNGNPVAFSFNLNSPTLKETFCAECNDEDLMLVRLLAKPHPAVTFAVPVRLGARYKSVSKVYISALEDKALSADFQRDMYSKFPETKVYTIQGPHMIMCAKPKEVVAILIEVASNQHINFEL